MALLQMVERHGADGASTRVEAVPNPEQAPASSFDRGEVWPLMTGAQDIVRIAAASAVVGFQVRSVKLVDRFFQEADEEQYADVLEAVTLYVTAGRIDAALAACRGVDLFVEQIRLLQKPSMASLDIRQNGVMFAKNIDIESLEEILNEAFDSK